MRFLDSGPRRDSPSPAAAVRPSQGRLSGSDAVARAPLPYLLHTDEGTSMIDRAGLLAEYHRLREVSRSLHNRLIKQIPKPVLTSSAERLGLLSPGPGRHGEEVLLLEDEYEISVLMDYCLYHGRQCEDGRTVIERAITEAPPAAGSDEQRLLQAMQDARFSVFAVEEAAPGIGVHVRDLLRDEPLFLVDIGFSQTADPGLVLAGNVVSLPGLSMTT